jgi:hypothetical protein
MAKRPKRRLSVFKSFIKLNLAYFLKMHKNFVL